MNFATEIKKIRLDCLLSQEDFAKELGVSAISINRWENAKGLPTLKARKAIDTFCKDHYIDFDIRELCSADLQT